MHNWLTLHSRHAWVKEFYGAGSIGTHDRSQVRRRREHATCPRQQSNEHNGKSRTERPRVGHAQRDTLSPTPTRATLITPNTGRRTFGVIHEGVCDKLVVCHAMCLRCLRERPEEGLPVDVPNSLRFLHDQHGRFVPGIGRVRGGAQVLGPGARVGVCACMRAYNEYYVRMCGGRGVSENALCCALQNAIAA
jgi:hypothetical protein